MIPRANITAWRRSAPWPDNGQVEQDLVLTRVLVELFRRPAVADSVAFRGGTALHKLFFDPPGRYSEDIDLVQCRAGPIGPVVEEVRAALDPWLGKPRWKASLGMFTMYYSFETTFAPVQRMRVKIEVNTREHFSVHGFHTEPLRVENPWFSGSVELRTYSLSELLGSKLRALYQRKKGRDLFDIDLGLAHPDFDEDRLLRAFDVYMRFGGAPVARAQFEENMEGKIRDQSFLNDVVPLARAGLRFDAEAAWSRVHAALVSRLAGEPWKGGGDQH